MYSQFFFFFFPVYFPFVISPYSQFMFLAESDTSGQLYPCPQCSPVIYHPGTPPQCRSKPYQKASEGPRQNMGDFVFSQVYLQALLAGNTARPCLSATSLIFRGGK